MKILVAEGTPESLKAARTATEAFKEHEFFFCSTASQALALLPTADALMTGFLFPQEKGRIQESWALYQEELSSILTGNYSQQRESLALSAMLTPYKSMLYDCHPTDMFAKFAKDVMSFLTLHFGYGGPLLIAAQEAGMFSVLVTNIHRYNSASDAEGSGHFLFAPLVTRKLMAHSEIQDLEGFGVMVSCGRMTINPSKDTVECWGKGH